MKKRVLQKYKKSVSNKNFSCGPTLPEFLTVLPSNLFGMWTYSKQAPNVMERKKK